MPAQHLLFVYGSLRRGQPAHGLLAAATFVSRACTAPCYRLIDLSQSMGPYPALTAGSQSVVGELYRCSPATLTAIDAYEDCPAVYLRVPIALLGRAEGALGYLWRGAPPPGRPIASGDWLAVASISAATNSETGR